MTNKIKITARDEEILKGLYMSPATRSEIKENYFKYSSNAAVSRRLQKLLRNNYILEKIIDDKVQYCLGEAGAKYLHEKFKYKIDHLNFSEKGFSVRRRKNRDRGDKKLVMSRRDLDICETLAAGPSTFKTLAQFFRKADGTQCSKQFIRRRLFKLADFGILKIVHYKYPGPSLVFYLDELGEQELIMRRNYDADSIRMAIARREELLHEFLIADVVRIIRSDVSELNYKVLFMYDDHFLRKKYANQKYMAIPDLYVCIQKDDGGKYHYFVEADTGKRPAWTLTEKLSKYDGGITKIVTLSHKRKELLKKMILDIANERVLLRTSIGAISDISKEGFLYSDGWTYLSDFLQKDSTKKT